MAYEVVERIMKLPARSKKAVLDPSVIAPSARQSTAWNQVRRRIFKILNDTHKRTSLTLWDS
jgi:hypothetical protein